MIKVFITKTLQSMERIDFFDDETKKSIFNYKTKRQQLERYTGHLLIQYIWDIEGFKDKIVYTPKPVIKDNEHLHISKAHSKGLVMVVISDTNVGADIEKLRATYVKKRILSDKELNEVTQFKNMLDKDLYILQLWTAKEAFVKFYGSLTKDYKNMKLRIIDENKHIRVGMMDNLYCYQSIFDMHVFSVVSEHFQPLEIHYIDSKHLL